MKTFIPYLLFLCLILVSNFSCKQTDKKESTGGTETQTTPSAEPGENTNSGTSEVDITAGKPVVENTASNAAKICGNPAFDLVSNIRKSAAKLTGTPYSRPNGTDCSGMFHKVLDGIRNVCPEATLPTFKADRTSRGIAKWYNDNGDFQFIRDPENSGHLIKPGMVMLYGHGGKTYDLQNMTIDDLANDGGINHVAIVVDVNEVDGKVQSYDIFHGLNPNPGNEAKITTEVFKNPKYPQHPAYAHWNEPWLAVANVLGAKK